MAIPGVSDQTPKIPPYFNQALENLKGQGNTEKTKEVVQDVITVLGSVLNLYVQSKTQNTMQQESNTTNGATGVPVIDNPGDPDAVMANLEALLAYLKLENDENQAEQAKGRIETQKSELEKHHSEQLEKLKESFKQMDKAAKSALLTKIFGWMMAALAVVFAAVMTVATGGLAIGATIGAVLAIGMAVANETGLIEDVTEKLTDALKAAGMKESAATIMAAVIMAVAMIAVSLVAGGGGSMLSGLMNSATKALSTTMTAVKSALENIMKTVGAASMAAGVAASVEGYKSGMVQADVTEMDKFLAVMRQQLEESQEELNAILEQIQNAVSKIIDILNSATDAQMGIAQQMGAMA